MTRRTPSPEKRPFADLTGRRILVTGSSSGIGAAMAIEFAQAGADVIIHCATSIDRAQQVCNAIKQLGRQSAVIGCDLSDLERLEDFVDTAWNQFSGLDVWVNNAGVDLLTGAGKLLSYEAKLQRLWEIDVRGTVLLSKRVGERMQSQPQGGVLLNIGWDQSDRGMEGDSGELFSTAKNAIMGFTRSLAVSLAPKVRVNCIAPGWIRTAWGDGAPPAWQERVLKETPLGRWGTPEDLARLARFVVSDDASYLTGQVLNANGGAVR
ncbi:MAG: SDR family oxidoreductase [Planctomycetaceae bacterium]